MLSVIISASNVSQAPNHDEQPRSVAEIVRKALGQQPSVSEIVGTALNRDEQPSVAEIVQTMRKNAYRTQGFMHGVQVGSAASNRSNANALAATVTSVNALSAARHKAQEISAWTVHCAEQASRLEQALSSRKKHPSFLKELASADRMGALKDTSIKAAILEGMGRTLLRGGSGGRNFSPGEKSFYGLMLTYGGVGALHVVSKMLGGPAVGTVQEWRRKSPRLKSGTSAAAIDHNVELVLDILKQYGAEGSYLFLCEDGSALRKRVDVQVEKTASGEYEVALYGLAGGRLVASSEKDVQRALTQKELATTIYVWLLVPLVEGAPAVPVVVDFNANNFTRTEVLKVQKRLWSSLAARGQAGRMLGDVSDGDSRLRSHAMVLHFHAGYVATKYIEIDHPLLQGRIPWIEGYGYHVQTLDWLHILWRMRVGFLKRPLRFGPIGISPQNLINLMTQGGATLGLRTPDTNAHEKQLTNGCFRLVGVDENGFELHPLNIIDQLKNNDSTVGEWLYLKFMRMYVQMFLVAEMCPERLCNHAGYVLGFLSTWRQLITSDRRLNLGDNFLTGQTYVDIVVSTQMLILLMKRCRDDGGENMRFLPKKFSSVYAEYLFGFCRSDHANATVFGALAGKTHVDHFIYRLLLELDNEVDLPTSGRHGKPRGPERVDWTRGKVASLAIPDDDGMADCVDDGIRLAISDAQHALAISGHPAMARSIDFGKVRSERLIVSRYHCSKINLNMDEAPGLADDMGGEGGPVTDGLADEEQLDDFSGLSNKELRSQLEENGLSRSGMTKDAMVAQLVAFSQGAGTLPPNLSASARKEQDEIEDALSKFMLNVRVEQHLAAPSDSGTERVFKFSVGLAKYFNALFVSQARERSGRFFGQRAKWYLPGDPPTEDKRKPTKEEMRFAGKRLEDKRTGARWRVLSGDDGVIFCCEHKAVVVIYCSDDVLGEPTEEECEWDYFHSVEQSYNVLE